ncbi:hypothetical protein [Bacillus sp. KH172YL63]|uniref:hypothetical protein n=1 Tax=Bacillus sp. KH172YL63 TaxID=2709784 RepID=UPI0013E478A6|nr:hypothetical protein [Bacillus sp. KH172YL63]BCB05232.1 hypothetical protein KH172YL63_33650 [Bacillus sp. KH172YL63]
MNKKFIIITLLLGAITVLMVGWSVSRGKMFDFNESELAKKMEGAPFQVKVPTKVPFEDMELYKHKYSSEEIEFTLFNADKEFLTVRAVKEEMEYPEEIKKKEMTIGSDGHGQYIPDYAGNRIISWQNEDLFYELAYSYKFSPGEVSRGQLMKMAESFR